MENLFSEATALLDRTPPLVTVSLAVLLLSLFEELGPGRQRRRLGERARSLRAEVAALQRRAAAFNTPSTFSKCAKLERQAIAREKEAQQIEARLGVASAIFSLVGLIRVLKGVLWVGVSLWFWNRPLLYVPPASVAPLSGLLAAPHYALWAGSGAVCALPCLAISYSACSSGIRRLVAY